MLLTRAADYAVRVMIHMATLPKGRRRSLPELARAVGAPQSFLSKVLQILSRSGMVFSSRGSEGGFEILARGRLATVREVTEAVDGPLFLNICLTSGQACERQPHCPAHPLWTKAQDAVVKVLDSISIDKLADSKASILPPAEISGTKQKVVSKKRRHDEGRNS